MSTVYQINYWNFTKEEMNQFHVFGFNFDDAKSEAEYYIAESIDEGNGWDIVSIEMMPEITLVNPEHLDEEDDEELPRYIGDCSCPFCSYPDSTKENQMDMHCPNCGGELKVSNVAWEAIFCPNCQTRIDREEVYKNEDGIWFVKDIERGKEE